MGENSNDSSRTPGAMLPSSVLKEIAQQTANLFGVLEGRFEQQMELQTARFDAFMAEGRQRQAEHNAMLSAEIAAQQGQRRDAAEDLQEMERRCDEMMTKARAEAENVTRAMRDEALQLANQLRHDASLTAEQLKVAVEARLAEVRDGE